MAQEEKPKIPPMALVLDLIGSAMFAVGIMAMFAGFEMVPEGLRFPFYDGVLIVGGVALMFPMFGALIEQARYSQK